MAGFISTIDESDYQSAMGLLHSTWAKPVIIYQLAQKTIINTNPNHNFVYSSGPNQTTTQNIVSSGIYNMRIHYPSDDKLDTLRDGSVRAPQQINLRKKDYLVKLICSRDARALLENCEKIEFNEIVYQIESDPRPHGVVGYQFFNFYLKAIN